MVVSESALLQIERKLRELVIDAYYWVHLYNERKGNEDRKKAIESISSILELLGFEWEH